MSDQVNESVEENIADAVNLEKHESQDSKVSQQGNNSLSSDVYAQLEYSGPLPPPLSLPVTRRLFRVLLIV
jgi:phosphatidylethanolamine-binding protein (PEBP) family uncharacterized protein